MSQDKCPHCVEYDIELYDTEREVHEIHVMLTELMDVLRPLKAMAAGLGPMQRMGMSPEAKAAAAKIKALS